MLVKGTLKFRRPVWIMPPYQWYSDSKSSISEYSWNITVNIFLVRNVYGTSIKHCPNSLGPQRKKAKYLHGGKSVKRSVVRVVINFRGGAESYQLLMAAILDFVLKIVAFLHIYWSTRHISMLFLFNVMNLVFRVKESVYISIAIQQVDEGCCLDLKLKSTTESKVESYFLWNHISATDIK